MFKRDYTPMHPTTLTYFFSRKFWRQTKALSSSSVHETLSNRFLLEKDLIFSGESGKNLTVFAKLNLRKLFNFTVFKETHDLNLLSVTNFCLNKQQNMWYTYFGYQWFSLQQKNKFNTFSAVGGIYRTYFNYTDKTDINQPRYFFSNFFFKSEKSAVLLKETSHIKSCSFEPRINHPFAWRSNFFFKLPVNVFWGSSLYFNAYYSKKTLFLEQTFFGLFTSTEFNVYAQLSEEIQFNPVSLKSYTSSKGYLTKLLLRTTINKEYLNVFIKYFSLFYILRGNFFGLLSFFDAFLFKPYKNIVVKRSWNFFLSLYYRKSMFFLKRYIFLAYIIKKSIFLKKIFIYSVKFFLFLDFFERLLFVFTSALIKQNSLNCLSPIIRYRKFYSDNNFSVPAVRFYTPQNKFTCFSLKKTKNVLSLKNTNKINLFVFTKFYFIGVSGYGQNFNSFWSLTRKIFYRNRYLLKNLVKYFRELRFTASSFLQTATFDLTSNYSLEQTTPHLFCTESVSKFASSFLTLDLYDFGQKLNFCFANDEKWLNSSSVKYEWLLFGCTSENNNYFLFQSFSKILQNKNKLSSVLNLSEKNYTGFGGLNSDFGDLWFDDNLFDKFSNVFFSEQSLLLAQNTLINSGIPSLSFKKFDYTPPFLSINETYSRFFNSFDPLNYNSFFHQNLTDFNLILNENKAIPVFTLMFGSVAVHVKIKSLLFKNFSSRTVMLKKSCYLHTYTYVLLYSVCFEV